MSFHESPPLRIAPDVGRGEFVGFRCAIPDGVALFACAQASAFNAASKDASSAMVP
jgi:hypothetical protein